jgi:hypothetical protein
LLTTAYSCIILTKGVSKVQRASSLNPRLKKFLHVVSVIGTFMFLFGAIYMIMKYTIGRLPIIKNTSLLGKVPLEVPLFVAATLLIMKRFIRISSPYRDQ